MRRNESSRLSAPPRAVLRVQSIARPDRGVLGRAAWFFQGARRGKGIPPVTQLANVGRTIDVSVDPTAAFEMFTEIGGRWRPRAAFLRRSNSSGGRADGTRSRRPVVGSVERRRGHWLRARSDHRGGTLPDGCSSSTGIPDFLRSHSPRSRSDSKPLPVARGSRSSIADGTVFHRRRGRLCQLAGLVRSRDLVRGVRRASSSQRRRRFDVDLTLLVDEPPEGRGEVAEVWSDSPSCPRQDSNLRTRLRRPALYPLSYGGKRLGRPRHDRLAAHEAS